MLMKAQLQKMVIFSINMLLIKLLILIINVIRSIVYDSVYDVEYVIRVYFLLMSVQCV